MTSMNSKQGYLVHVISAICLILGIAADQLSKLWVLENLPGNEMDIIPGFLSLQYAENRNMAFGLGSSIPPEIKNWALIALTSILAVALLIFLFRCADKLMRISLLLIASGAIGNIIDRIRIGFVVDFIRWYGGFRWPNFNVADSFICIGVGLMLIASFRGAESPFGNQPAKDGAEAGEGKSGKGISKS